MKKFNADLSMFIPDEMRNVKQWVCWDSKKRPVNSKSGGLASTTDSATWSDFDSACSFYENHTELFGIGFVLANGFVGLDFDDCLGPGGEIAEHVLTILGEVKSYSEISPSGTGIHIIFKANYPEGVQGVKTDKYELYPHSRFFTVTGDSLPAFPSELEDIGNRVIKYIPKEKFNTDVLCHTVKISEKSITFGESLDSEKFEALCENEPRFKSVFDRSLKSHKDTSPSASDMIMLNIAVDAGWSDEELLALMIAFRKRHDFNLKIKNKQYYLRTIQKVRSSKKPIEDYNYTQALALVREMSKQAICLVKQVGVSDPKYVLEYDDGSTHQFPRETDFESMNYWRYLSMYKGTEAMALTRKEWPKFCTAVIKVKENFESEDMSVREAIADSVSDYLLKQKDRICDRSDTDTYLLAFSQQLPFSDGDDICICPDALRTYMKFNGKDDSISAVRQGLIRMGFIKVCYVETISGYKYRHTYYRVNREDTSF